MAYSWPRDPEFQSVFRSYIEWASRIAVENSHQVEVIARWTESGTSP
jgi:hypothetical protein